jgi:hypothetical protein
MAVWGHAIMQLKKDTSYDDDYRRLVNAKKAEWGGLRGVLRAAGIAVKKEVYVSQWLKGKLDHDHKPYPTPPPLNGEPREKLFAFLKTRYPKDVAEIEGAPIRAMLEEAAKIAKKVRTPSELDRFAEYVRNGANITRVTANSVTAEGGESARSYEPREGLTEEDYQRLADDDLSFDMQEKLAWSVIENLLRKKGLTEGQIGKARHRVSKASISELVIQNSFEVVANAFYKDVKRAHNKKRQ